MGTIQTKVAGDSYLNLEERERTFVSPRFTVMRFMNYIF